MEFNKDKQLFKLNKINDSFAESLKNLRKQYSVSQRKVCDAVGITQGSYKKYETGSCHPSFETLVLLSAFFECSVSYLLGESDI